MTMMRVRMGLAAAAGLMAGALAWAASSSSVDSYAKVEAESLVRSPQNSWARAILFTDVLKTPPDGRRSKKHSLLCEKNYKMDFILFCLLFDFPQLFCLFCWILSIYTYDS